MHFLNNNSKDKMKNKLSMKLSQKLLLTEKYTMSWLNILALLTCERANMPPRSNALAAGTLRLC